MPPFQYDTRPNPFVGSIGDVMLRRGDIAAQQAMTAANAGAAALRAGGEAYGGAIRDIGQSVAGTIARATDPRVKAEQLQLEDAQRMNRSRNIFEAELKNPGNYKPDGTVDDAKIAERLKQQDVGAWQQWSTISAANQQNTLNLHKTLGEIAKNDVELTEKQRLAREAQGKYLGELAFHTEQVLKTGPEDPLHARDTFMASVARGITDGVIAPGEGKAMLTHTAQATPAQLQALVSSAVPPTLRGELESKAATTAKTTAEAAKATAEAAAIAKNGLGSPPASQQVKVRMKLPGGATSDVPVEFLPGRSATEPGAYYFNQPDGARRQVFPVKDFTEIPAASLTIHNDQKAGAPGDFSKSGEDFLESIPVQWRATVKKIAHYDEDPTKVASMRGGNREMLMQWVNQVNPGYDASEFTNRAPTRKAFTTGTQGQQITAINTAIGHLDQLAPLVAELNNGSFTPGNKALNAIGSIFGSAKVTNFETLKDALAGEVASVLSKGAATVSGIAAEKEKIQAASSPAQLAGYVKTLIPLMGSKLAALDYQYHQAMGAEDAYSALSPASKSVLAKYGFDPAQHAAKPGDPITVGGFSVVVK